MKKKKNIGKLIETGSDITGNIASAAVGGFVNGVEGWVLGGIVGPLVTQSLKQIGIELQQRLLSPREGIRIGAAYTYAIERFQEITTTGLSLRNDDEFFKPHRGKRAPADEILEGVIITAQREYEEQKIKYLGFLYANICARAEVTKEHANQLIKLANALSFRQFCILRLLYKKYEAKQDLKFTTPEFGKNPLNIFDVIIEMRDLQQRGLLSIATRWNDVNDNSAPIMQDDISINTGGIFFCEIMSLDRIDQEDLNRTNLTVAIKE